MKTSHVFKNFLPLLRADVSSWLSVSEGTPHGKSVYVRTIAFVYLLVAPSSPMVQSTAIRLHVKGQPIGLQSLNVNLLCMDVMHEIATNSLCFLVCLESKDVKYEKDHHMSTTSTMDGHLEKTRLSTERISAPLWVRPPSM